MPTIKSKKVLENELNEFSVRMTRIGAESCRGGSQEQLRTGLALQEIKDLKDLRKTLKILSNKEQDSDSRVAMNKMQVEISKQIVSAIGMIGDMPHTPPAPPIPVQPAAEIQAPTKPVAVFPSLSLEHNANGKSTTIESQVLHPVGRRGPSSN